MNGVFKYNLFFQGLVKVIMETLSSGSSPTKKLKVTEADITVELLPTAAADTLLNDDPMDLPNDSEPESEDPDDLDDASSYDDEDFSYYDESFMLQAQFDAADLPPGVEASVPWLEQLDDKQKQAATSNEPTGSSTISEEQVLEKFKQFKNFDTVEDFSDNHYFKGDSASKQALRDWAKTIQSEWKILETNLPEMILVRVCEERMDLLRAVIIGAAGTPYHDGLFFFDVLFPSNYPNVPPKVYYHSGGLRLNPNLYNCGRVCLSLLGTWPGENKEENWTPGKSTMLQVLLSIQALVLNEKPYFNEPGYENSAGQKHGQLRAKDYNESTFVLSLKTMLYTLQRPPKHFEDFVAGHFLVRAHSILEACKEYVKGAEVGCLIDEEAQEEQEVLNDGETGSYKSFRKSLRLVVGSLIPALIKNGAKNCEKYIPLGDITRTAALKI